MFEKKPNEPDPLKSPKITSITSVILIPVTLLLLSTVCYLPLTSSAMGIFVGFCGIRCSLAEKGKGFFCLSLIGMTGGLLSLALTIAVMVWQLHH